VLGWTARELLERPLIDFVHPGDRQATVAAAGRARSGDRVVHFTNRYRAKDGSYRWLDWTATPAGHGLIYGSARDVTASMTAEHTQREEGRARRTLIQRAIDGDPSVQLTTAWQPIVDLRDHEVCGPEALSRFAIVPERTPDRWFADAEAVGLRVELELRALRNAARLLGAIPAAHSSQSMSRRPHCWRLNSQRAWLGSTASGSSSR
jgi:hypothetical protein